MSDARQAMRAELFDVCSEGAFGLTFVTTSDPLAEKRGDPVALSSDEVRLLVHEFVRAGFRHVGVLRGGFAALSPEQAARVQAFARVADVMRRRALAGREVAPLAESRWAVVRTRPRRRRSAPACPRSSTAPADLREDDSD